MDTFLSIDEVARRTGLSAHTLRYYERIGLIGPVTRGSDGRRRYSAADVAWIDFLLRLRDTRMPVASMLAFARLRAAGEQTAGERRQMLEKHLATVVAEIATLQQSAAALADKIAHYRRLEDTGAAPQPSSRRKE